MFKPKQDADQTRIKLPRRSMPPTKDYLEFASAQAFQYREKEVEITWTDYSVSRLFSLIVKAGREAKDPNWTLWEENNQGSQFIWSGETLDIKTIEEQIAVVDPLVGDRINAQSPRNTFQGKPKLESPYRKMFSSSYHGINAVQPTNSLRESFIKMRPVYINRDTASMNSPTINNDYFKQQQSAGTVINPSQIIEEPVKSDTQTNSEPDDIPRDAPAVLIKQLVTKGLTDISGAENKVPVYAISSTTVSGTLEHTSVQNKHLIKLLALNKISGKLELTNQIEGAGLIFFQEGIPYNAYVSGLDEQSVQIKGEEAIIEMMLWSPSSFRFFVGEATQIHDISNNLETIIKQALSLREQLVHLEKAGWKPQALMIKKQDSLGDSELKLYLSKNSEDDMTELVALYKSLPKRFTVNNLFDNEQGNKSSWVPIVFNLFTSGLIEIRSPVSTDDSSLNFLGDAKAAVQSLKNIFIRQETGILTYPAFLYFLQYEYLRYQSYDCPFSLIVFEMNKVGDTPLGGLDLINKQETVVALKKIQNVKRPLDILGHFETINYALLLPDTTTEVANQIAKKILSVLSAQPLSSDWDPKLLKLSFGVGGIPREGGELEDLVLLTKKALQKSKNGDFSIVQASTVK